MKKNKFLKNSEIMRILVIMSFTIALVSTLLCWWQISESTQRYTHAKEKMNKFKKIRVLIVANHLLGNERGYTNELLFSTVEDRTLTTNLVFARNKTDIALRELMQDASIFKEVSEATILLKNARQKIDNASGSQSRPTEVHEAIKSLLYATSKFEFIFTDKSLRYANEEASGSGYFYTLLFLGEIRDSLGRLATPYLYSLRYNIPMTVDDITSVTQVREKIEFLWLMLQDFDKKSALLKNLKFNAQSDYYKKIDRLTKEITTQQKNDTLKINPTSFSISYREGLNSLQLLADVYLNDLEGDLIENKKSELFKLIMVIFSLVILLLLIVLVCILIKGKIFRPLMYMNYSIQEIISNNTRLGGSPSSKSDGIQSITQSIIILEKILNQQKLEVCILEREINKDSLTGIGNRRSLIEKNLELRNKKNINNFFWLSIIDIDNFKLINDTWGHPFGDTVIASFADVLKKDCRSDDFCIRLGGEEFIVIFHAESCTEAKKFLSRIQHHIRQLSFITPNGINIGITASFGAMKHDVYDLEGIIEKTDAALYKAKNSGRDCIVWV
ncbi:GGDEF domain-containing protein [Pseudomonas cerasi]